MQEYGKASYFDIVFVTIRSTHSSNPPFHIAVFYDPPSQGLIKLWPLSLIQFKLHHRNSKLYTGKEPEVVHPERIIIDGHTQKENNVTYEKAIRLEAYFNNM